MNLTRPIERSTAHLTIALAITVVLLTAGFLLGA